MSTRANMRPAARLCSVTCNACHSLASCALHDLGVYNAHAVPHGQRTRIGRRQFKWIEGRRRRLRDRSRQFKSRRSKSESDANKLSEEGRYIITAMATWPMWAALLLCTSSAQKLTNAALEWRGLPDPRNSSLDLGQQACRSELLRTAVK